jgi:hypothetical protein
MSKNTIIALLGAAIVALSLCADYCWERYSEEKEKARQLENTIDQLNQELDTFSVALNDSVRLHAARVQDMKMTIGNLESKCGTLLKKLSEKPKNVEKLVEVETYVHDTVTVAAKVDSTGTSARYRDDFADIKVLIDYQKNAFFDYSIKDSLTIISTRKRHSILFGLIKWKSKNVKTTIVNHNPKANITKFEAIETLE